MNPLDLPGPQFLLIYSILFAVAAAIGWGIRKRFRDPDDDPSDEALDLSGAEIVYLAGGDDLLARSTIAKLVHDGALAVRTQGRGLTAVEGKCPPAGSSIERAVWNAIDDGLSNPVAAARKAVQARLGSVRRRLTEQGLLVADPTGFAYLAPLAIMTVVVVLGAAKIAVGIARDRPVSVLVILCAASVCLAVFAFGRKLHRSIRGDIALDRLRRNNSPLKSQSGSRIGALSGDEVALAVGLFGFGLLAGGTLSPLNQLLAPESRWGGSDSGGSCGGGCGGGGCGGGGCGGCGS